MDYLIRLNRCSEFSDSFKERVNETKELFKTYDEYIKKPMIKCCVVGNVSVGKSTLINVLLGKYILYEGNNVATLCAAICQSSPKTEEYFQMYRGKDCLNKHMPIEKVEEIKSSNREFSRFSMDTNNHLDIYLKVSNHAILDKFILIDCPGFNDDNLDAISKYCKNADIIVFCFRANAGVTDRDIEKIEQIKSNIGKFQTSFIINCFNINEFVDRNRIILRLSPLLSGEDAIYFISALEEKERMWKTKKGILNDPRHGEFELFKECLQKQKSLAIIMYRTVYLNLISSVNTLLRSLNDENFQNDQFRDETFEKIHREIIQLINNDNKIYYKADSNMAMMEYSNQANNVISKFMMKQFIIDNNLNYGNFNENYFYKRIIENDSVKKPSFSWFEWGVKSGEMKTCFKDYFNENSTNILMKINGHYKNRAEIFKNNLKIYEMELEKITNNLNELANSFS